MAHSKRYWHPRAAALVLTAALAFCLQPAQARYVNTASWHTLVQPQAAVYTSDCLYSAQQAPVTVQLGAVTARTEVRFTLSSSVDVTAPLLWSVPDASLFTVELFQGEMLLQQNAAITLTAGTPVTLTMVLNPGSTPRQEQSCEVTVNWNDNALAGRFVLQLPAIAQPEPPVETTPEEGDSTGGTEGGGTDDNTGGTDQGGDVENGAENPAPEAGQQPTDPAPETPAPETPAEPEPTPDPTPDPEQPDPSQPTALARPLALGVAQAQPVSTQTDEPAQPETPTQPTEPVTPGEEDTPADPETPEGPGTSEAPDTTETPEAPDAPDTTTPTTPPPAAGELVTVPVYSAAAARLPIRIKADPGTTAVTLGLQQPAAGPADDQPAPDTGEAAPAVFTPLPERTRYSDNAGASWTLLYFGGTVTLPLADGQTETELLLALPQQTQSVTLAARYYQGDALLGTAVCGSAPAAPPACAISSRTLTAEAPIAITVTNDPWQAEGYTFTCELQLLALETDDRQTWQPVPAADTFTVAAAALQPPPDADPAAPAPHGVTIAAGARLPAAGTYRAVLTWKYQGLAIAETCETFFVNYALYNASTTTGGASQ